MNKKLIWDFYREHIETEEDNLQGMIRGKSIIAECFDKLKMLKDWKEATDLNDKIHAALKNIRKNITD